MIISRVILCIFLMSIGIAASQYFVVRFAKNLLRLKDSEKTIIASNQRFHDATGGFITIDAASLRQSLNHDKIMFIISFIILNMIWVLIIGLCFSTITVQKQLLIMFIYSLLLLVVSGIVFYIYYYHENENMDNYVYFDFLYQ